MDITSHAYWEENSNLRVKYEGCNINEESSRLKDDRSIFPCCETTLNFSTATCSEDDTEFPPYKKSKSTRQDPMSHRIIEKRRRDRMNNCLADLSRLIPTEYLKKGRGRIEKTEIIEMAIKHMKFLQQEHDSPSEHYRLGYQECMSETMRFMVEVEGHFSHEAICVRLLTHLQKHCASLAQSPNAVPQTVPSTDHHLNLNQPETNEVHSMQVPEYHSKINNSDAANNNISNHSSEEVYSPIKANGNVYHNLCNGRNTTASDDLDLEAHQFEKHKESNALSYKYKNNIKMRFHQDVSSENDLKRTKLRARRASVNSLEQSSSRSSPPNSEVCTRISESDTHLRSSSDNTLSPTNNQFKLETLRNEPLYSSPKPFVNSAVNFRNFNVPIFVLHAKGSFYIPLTIDYKTLLPFLQNFDILEVLPNMHNILLHPVTINVNFQPSYANNKSKYKLEY